MVQAGLAEMHLAVDHAGQHMQALAVDTFAGRRADRSPISASARPECRYRAHPTPSWLTTVPLVKTQSKLGGMAVLSCSGAEAADSTVSALASATGALSMHKKAATLEDRGVLSRERRGCDDLLAGPLDQRC